MTETFNGRKRIEAALKKQPLDRPAISGWRHMPLVDRDVEAFAEATIAFTDENDWDLIKLMSQGQFFAEAYGTPITFSTDAQEWAGKILDYPIRSAEDLTRLVPLKADNPVIQREAAFAKKIVEHYKGEKVVVGTVFSPLSWVKQFAPGNDSIAHIVDGPEESPIAEFLEHHREELKAALDVLHASNKVFVDELIAAGVDGFFIAEQYSQRGDISEADYAAFAKPYTDDLLAYIKDRTWFNILHAHGHVDLAVERFIDYDVQAINWEDGSDHAEDPTGLSFRKLRALTDKLLVGGISPKTDLTFSNQAQEIEDLLVDRLADVLTETGDTGIVFAPGCAISLEANPDFYQRIHAAAQKVQATILKTANH